MIGTILLILVLFLTNACSIKLINRKTPEERAKIKMEKYIFKIIEKAERATLGKAQNNIVFVVGSLTEKKAIRIISEINQVEDDLDFKEMIIYLDSTGGKVSAGFAICRTMTNCRKDIKIICRNARSAAAGILVSGTKGKRFVLVGRGLPGVMIFQLPVMIHPASYTDNHKSIIPRDQLSEFHVAMLIYSDKMECDLLSEKTILARSQIIEAINKTTYYLAEYAIEFGFADEIIPYK